MNIGALLLDEKRALNIRLGMKDTDDYLPSLVRKKIEGEPEESEIKDEEMESLLKRYNEVRRSVS